MNLRLFRLNSWSDCVAILRNIARHGSHSDLKFTRKMLDPLILNLMLSLSNCKRNLTIIVYTKAPILNNSSKVSC